MKVRARGAARIVLAIVIAIILFVRMCVRIVPADAPIAAPAPASPPAPAGHGPLLIPVEGVGPRDLTDSYTQARAGGARAHDAIDILAPRGRAVLAAADGRIDRLFWSTQGGRTVYQRSADGRIIYYYAHLDSYAPGLHQGAAVRRGARIATVGSTGNADPAAPHLHFAVAVMTPGEPWYRGRAINPYPLLVRSR